MLKIFIVKSFDFGLSVLFFKYQYRFWLLRKRINQYIRMGRYDQLSSLGCIDKQISNLGKHIGVKAQFWFFNTNQWRRSGVKQ